MSKIGWHWQTLQTVPRPEWGPGREEHPIRNWAAHAQPIVATIVINDVGPVEVAELNATCPRIVCAVRKVPFVGMDDLIREANQRGIPKHWFLVGYNEGRDGGGEPTTDDPVALDSMAVKEAENAIRAHAAGYRYGLGSWSYGATEQVVAAPSRLQSSAWKEAFEKADCVVIHSYGSDEGGGSPRDRSFDYRGLYAILPAKRPIFIKEYGPAFPFLKTVVSGDFFPAENYVFMLQARDTEWAKDDYLIGVCLWNWDSGKYEDGAHDLNRNKDFVAQLADYVRSSTKHYWDWTWKPPVIPPPQPTGGWERLRYFRRSEFRLPDMVDMDLLYFLDAWRHESGQAFYPTSDGRTLTENAEIYARYGLPPNNTSLHLFEVHGKTRAVDFVIKPWTWEAVDRVVAAYIRVRTRWHDPNGWEIGIGGARKARHLHLGRRFDDLNLLFPE